MNIYISSSWKNRGSVRGLAVWLRELGYEVFDFTDPKIRRSPEIPPEKFPEQFDPDKHEYATYINRPEWLGSVIENQEALRSCDLVLLLLPCGNDAHADWAYGVGQGKASVVYGQPHKGERTPTHLWADLITNDQAELASWLRKMEDQVPQSLLQELTRRRDECLESFDLSGDPCHEEAALQLSLVLDWAKE